MNAFGEIFAFKQLGDESISCITLFKYHKMRKKNGF